MTDPKCIHHRPCQCVEDAEAIRRVEALCDQWDRLSKGPTPTTIQIRQAIDG